MPNGIRAALLALALSLPAALLAQEPARTDALGDPLPPDALRRLGTTRHRVHSAHAGWLSLPNGHILLTSEGNGAPIVGVRPGALRWMDAVSGRIVDSWSLPEKH